MVTCRMPQLPGSTGWQHYKQWCMTAVPQCDRGGGVYCDTAGLRLE
jgi:hypothetical protein